MPVSFNRSGRDEPSGKSSAPASGGARVQRVSDGAGSRRSRRRRAVAPSPGQEMAVKVVLSVVIIVALALVGWWFATARPTGLIRAGEPAAPDRPVAPQRRIPSRALETAAPPLQRPTRPEVPAPARPAGEIGAPPAIEGPAGGAEGEGIH